MGVCARDAPHHAYSEVVQEGPTVDERKVERASREELSCSFEEGLKAREALEVGLDLGTVAVDRRQDCAAQRVALEHARDRLKVRVLAPASW